MRIVGAILDRLLGLPLVETGSPLLHVRSAETSDHAGVLSLALSVREKDAAAKLAAMSDLDGRRCDCGCVIHCWVAVNRFGDVLGVLAAIDQGRQISLVDLVVDGRGRGIGIGHALLATLADFADARHVPIIALVRGSDVAGLSWLCERDFSPAQFVDGRSAIVPDAFPGEACEEGIGLYRPGPRGAVVRIAE